LHNDRLSADSNVADMNADRLRQTWNRPEGTL